MRDHRVNVRLPVWLYDDLKRCAEAWDGDVSKQIRYELAERRGKLLAPSMPRPPTKPRRVA